ncbi:unnamed protein product [Blepharisma stoltei]|uniref:Uncharacterized protein n=1 Tax=Blepharisma stoltei TaxID=1481888 RepID=A0AAU9JJQ9_9CILI|nr:unnamed protein product [Blepharisma stoltei]
MDAEIQQLANEFLYAIHNLKSKSDEEVQTSLQLIQQILSLHFAIPESFSKQIFIQLGFLKKKSKHSDTLIRALQIESVLLTNYDSSWLNENSQESEMHVTILLSGIIKLAEESDSRVRKEAWSTLNSFFTVISQQEIIKKCYPGIMKCLISEVERFNNQGLGTSKYAFGITIEVLIKVLEYISDRNNDEWTIFAKEKCKGFISSLSKELISIVASNYDYSKEIMLDLLKFLLENLKETLDLNFKEILKCYILISADLEVFPFLSLIDKNDLYSISYSLLKSLILITDISMKKRSMNSLVYSLQLLGDSLPYFLTRKANEIVSIIKQIIKFSVSVLREFSLKNVIEYCERDENCHKSLEKLLTIIVKYEIFDQLIEEQSEGQRKLAKNNDFGIADDLLKIAYLLSFSWPQNSIYILKELTIKSCETENKFIIRSLLLQLTLKHSKEMELTDILDSIMLTYEESTKESCLNLIETISKEKNFESINEMIKKEYSSLKQSMIAKIKIFGIDQIKSALLCLLEISQNVDLLTDSLLACLQKFDKSYQIMDVKTKLGYIELFSMLVPYIREFQISEKIQNANLIRSILMRLKLFLALKMNQLENRKLIMATINFYISSVPCLSNFPIEIDRLDKSPFAIEEGLNVTIPNALTEISYEYFPSLVFCMKSLADSNCFGISLAILNLFSLISQKNPEFFVTESRFSKRIFPNIKIIMLQPHSDQSYKSRLYREIVDLIKLLDRKCIDEIKPEIIGCSKYLINSQFEEIKAIGEELNSYVLSS